LVEEANVTSAGTDTADKPSRPHMSTRTKILFWITAWAIVLMPFLFWRSTWFGRPLNDKEVSEYISDSSKPRHIQHALVQVGERIAHGDRSAQQWYPALVKLSNSPVEEIRNTDAWVMGQDNTQPEFHQALLAMLSDSSSTVRGNAALSLVRFGDGTGRPQIVALLQPIMVKAPHAGTVSDAAKEGQTIREGGLVAKIGNDEVRGPAAGRVISTKAGATVKAGEEIAVLAPPVEQVWEALRALALIGQADDLPLVRSYKRSSPELPQRIQQQAAETERAITEHLRQ
jgi:biotin carboxyl carrier protein